MQKVAIQLQPLGCTLFGVELRGENIIACDGRGKSVAVLGLGGAVRGVAGAGVETVHEVEPLAVGLFKEVITFFIGSWIYIDFKV